MMLAYENLRILFLLSCLTFYGACQKPKTTAGNGRVSEEKPAASDLPVWLKNQISAFEKDKPANPPVKIFRYQFRGQAVYFITGRCCDIPSQVFTVEGQQICQPDGGFTGRGDGQCPDFFETRKNEKLIWEDLRK